MFASLARAWPQMWSFTSRRKILGVWDGTSSILPAEALGVWDGTVIVT